MGYENFQPVSATDVARVAIPSQARRLRRLSDIERSVVDIARKDGPRSAEPNSAANHLRWLFGLPTIRPLANERLEGLRRFAVAAWFADEIPARSIRALLECGFTSNDAARVISYVARERGKEPEVEAWP